MNCKDTSEAKKKIGILASKSTNTEAFEKDVRNTIPNADIICEQAENCTAEIINSFIANNKLRLLFVEDKLANDIDCSKINASDTIIFMSRYK